MIKIEVLLDETDSEFLNFSRRLIEELQNEFTIVGVTKVDF